MVTQLEVTMLKKQTGIWVDGQVWRAYRDLCGREKLRPAEPIEEYVRFVLRNGSALAVLNMLRGVERARSEGLEAYARVLLNWYANGRRWIHVTDENQAPVEPMLLHTLKDVSDPQLRRQIEEALMIMPSKKAGDRRKAKKAVDKEAEVKTEDEEAEDSVDAKKNTLSDDEVQKRMDELKKMRELLKGAKTG
jgi:hypothetical protein